MKKLSILMLSLATLPANSASMLESLSSYQDSLSSDGAVTKTTSPVDVKPSAESISSSSAKCEEDDQTSLPLALVTSLIMQKNASLDFTHDPRSNSLSISSADMISNCSSMLEWQLKQPEIQGRKSYAVEVKIKQGESCDAGGCAYKVARVEKGEFKNYDTMFFKPTLKGFEECIEKSGVRVDGKIVPGAIYPSPVKEKFSGLEHTGPLMFLSHGPQSPMIKAKYGKFSHVDGCDYYETAHPQVGDLLTYSDAEKIRLDAEAAKLKECKHDEYSKIADFIEKNENYLVELGSIRDRLIMEAAAKSAAAIASGKYTEKDIEVMNDFDRYVVSTKVATVNALYNQVVELEGDAKKGKQEQLKVALAEILALNQKPYFLASHAKKLLDDGRFDDSERLNSMKLVMEHHQRLGSKQDNVLITPEVAAERVAASRAAFSQALEIEKENYEIRTGQVTGKAQTHAQLASRMRNNIQIRTQNFMAEIQLEYQRVQQPNGYCFKYYRNTQKCIQDSMQRIQELQALAQHYNNVDSQRAAEYDAEAKKYGELEAQGSRYIAAQNGEVGPPAAGVAGTDTTTVPARPQDTPPPGTYNFNYQAGQQPQLQGPVQPGPLALGSQYQPYQYQNPTTPYQNQNMFQQQQYPYQQQRPWLGQQSYGGYQQYTNGMPGQYNYQQQQAPYMGYNQPYYGQSMYGR